MPEKDFWIEFIGDRSARIFKDQTILQASLASGIPHYHDCGGQARCSTCRILVQTGMDQLSSVNEKEAALRKVLPFPENVRLACQTYVLGQPVTVHRIIRDDTDIAMYIEEDWRPDQQHIGEEKRTGTFFPGHPQFHTLHPGLPAFRCDSCDAEAFHPFQELH